MPRGNLDRLIYIDDSTHPKCGLVVYGWVEFRPAEWHDVLGEWLAHRKRLWRHWKDLGRELARENLETLGSIAGLRVGAVFRVAPHDAHRELPRETRCLIEDPVYMDSGVSQIMQMADHVAWCANAAITRAAKHAFAHHWYEQYLAVHDLRRAPLRV